MIGAGSAGCVVAARLSQDPAHRVILIEAGGDPFRPDVGPPLPLLTAGGWLASPSWAHRDAETRRRLDCGRVVGGSSVINAAGFNWPHRLDLGSWPASWRFDRLLPYLQAVEADPAGPAPLHGRGGPIPVLRDAEPLSPFFAAFAEAAATGFIADPNDAAASPGLARRTRNIRGGLRWNAALAYLAPARSRTNLRVLAGTVAQRLLVANGRVLGGETSRGRVIRAARTVLTAGAYGTPALLLRSGIGPAAIVRRLGWTVHADRPGVGQALRDHPIGRIAWRLAASSAPGPLWQMVLRARSPIAADAGFDLQIAPEGPVPGRHGWAVSFAIEVMQPRATGTVELDTVDGPPRIRSNLLGDAHDRAVMTHGAQLAREIAARPPLAALLGREGGTRSAVVSYHHPCGTCRMGDDAAAVVDAAGRVHGVGELHIADASVFPAIPRVPLHHLVLAVAARIADGLCGSE